MEKIILHNDKNVNNHRWLMVVNDKTLNNEHHRDFQYYKYKISYWYAIAVFKLFWGSFDKERLFIQTYDMKNLKHYKVGELTKQLAKAGYFQKMTKYIKTRRA